MKNLENALIIIESPNKVEKISKITNARVIATAGHFKELTKNFIKDFTHYEPIFDFKDEKKKKSIYYALQVAENKDIYIATDPDREGYAIGYFFYQMLKNKNVKSIQRAEFFEITENGIKKGIENAIPFKESNYKLFESFKARITGDKLCGFILSPKYSKLLNEKISIGRVQTPLLSLIVKKHQEIKEYEELPKNKKIDYKIKATSKKNNINFSIINNNLYNNQEEAFKIIEQLPKKAKCYNIEKKEVKTSPKQPYRTSQYQEAVNKILGISPKESMQIAQKLFEKGLITYHRTDSNSLSLEFLQELETNLKNQEWYQKREYKAGEQSQAEAHEAIRITHYHDYEEIDKIAQENDLSKEEKEVYTLIYKNTITSQAKDSINEVTNYAFAIKSLLFYLKNSKCIYAGYKNIFNSQEETETQAEEAEETETQNLNLEFSKGDEIDILEFSTQEVKKNQPRPYKESNIITILEKNKIGRPSTYATFLPLLLERNFVTLEKKGKDRIIMPTESGIRLIEKLKVSDEWITQPQFTIEMENILDLIAKGELNYLDFIKPLHQKMNFAELNSNAPTQKQIEYLKKIASEVNKEIPQEAFKDFELCTKLITECEKLNVKPPTQKQIDFAEKIASELKIDLPKNYKGDYKICSKFIDTNFKKLKKSK